MVLKMNAYILETNLIEYKTQSVTCDMYVHESVIWGIRICMPLLNVSIRTIHLLSTFAPDSAYNPFYVPYT